MSAPGDRDARIPFTRFREYEGAGGKRYFKAWVGDTVWLLFPSDAEPDFGAVAVWDCVITPRKPKANSGTGQGARRQTGRSSSWQAPARTRSEPTTFDDPNDDLPF